MGFLPSTDPETWGLENVAALLQNIITLATTLAGGIAIIYLIIGAFQYFTAFGSDEKATKAKLTILWAIVGLVVIIVGKVIISEVWNLVSLRGITL